MLAARGEVAGLGCLDGGADGWQAGLGCVVGVEDAGLPRGEIGLVGDVEEEQALDGGLAGRQGEGGAVALGLGRLGDGVRVRCRLVRVDGEFRCVDLGLDAELALEDRQC